MKDSWNFITQKEPQTPLPSKPIKSVTVFFFKKTHQ